MTHFATLRRGRPALLFLYSQQETGDYCVNDVRQGIPRLALFVLGRLLTRMTEEIALV